MAGKNPEQKFPDSNISELEPQTHSSYSGVKGQCQGGRGISCVPRDRKNGAGPASPRQRSRSKPQWPELDGRKQTAAGPGVMPYYVRDLMRAEGADVRAVRIERRWIGYAVEGCRNEQEAKQTGDRR
jgi:hypothetical protein